MGKKTAATKASQSPAPSPSAAKEKQIKAKKDDVEKKPKADASGDEATPKLTRSKAKKPVTEEPETPVAGTKRKKGSRARETAEPEKSDEVILVEESPRTSRTPSTEPKKKRNAKAVDAVVDVDEEPASPKKSTPATPNPSQASKQEKAAKGSNNTIPDSTPAPSKKTEEPPATFANMTPIGQPGSRPRDLVKAGRSFGGWYQAKLKGGKMYSPAPARPAQRKAFAFHRCRFVDHMPSAITALAFSPEPPAASPGSSYRNRILLACARANGDLELWNPIRWHLERVIPGIPGSTIESVVWIDMTQYSNGTRRDEEDDDEMEVDGGDDADEKEQDEGADADAEDNTSDPGARSERAGPRTLKSRRSRLLSAGTDGFITEWDLVSLRPLNRVESGGGAVWSMAVSPNHTEIALGCEDGTVRVFNVAGPPGTIEYISTFDKQDARILSVAYHPTQPILAAGSTDSCIRTFSTASRRCLSRMTLDTAGHEETMVWTLTYLPDGTLVSGDSMGTVTFWDVGSRTMRRKIRAHAADVLCLAATKAGDAVFSSGIDRKVVQYRQVDAPSGVSSGDPASSTPKPRRGPAASKMWVVSGERRFHSHDVSALALCETKPVDALVSGGVDTILTISTTASQFPHSKQIRHQPFPQRPLVSVAERARFILCRYPDKVKVWALGSPADVGVPFEEMKAGERVAMLASQRFIAEIKVKGATNLTAATISKDGRLIALSDLHTTKLFRLTVPKSAPRPSHEIQYITTKSGKKKPQLVRTAPSEDTRAHVTRIKEFPSPSVLPGSVSMTFTPDSRRLVLGGADSVVRVVDITPALADASSLGGSDNASIGSGSRGFEVVATFRQHLGVTEAEEEEAAVSGVSSGGVHGRELVASVSVSGDGQWLATGDLANRIHIFNLDSLMHHATLPRPASLHTALSFQPDTSVVAVATASNELFLYDAEERRLTDWSRSNSHRLPVRFVTRSEIIMGVTGPPERPGILNVWAGSYLCTIDLDKPVGSRDAFLTGSGKRQRFFYRGSHGAKDGREGAEGVADEALGNEEAAEAAKARVNGSLKRKANGASAPSTPVAAGKVNGDVEGVDLDSLSDDNVDGDEDAEGEDVEASGGASSFSMDHRYGPFMYFGFLGANEAIAVELPLLEVVEKLPPGFYRKRYGT
ncbi:U3 small nucleolar RNA-associated protein [Phlyctochytrium bullatum]|nr:U3 small nucleolar RNA-associated protein [Phlyctochytrium bullatum]